MSSGLWPVIISAISTGIEPQLLTPEFVLWDRDGKRRADVLSMEAQMQQGIALERDVKALERQLYWGKGHCTWDLSHAELRRAMREHLGLNDFLDPGKEWTEYDLEPYANKARALATEIQTGLNFTIPAGQKPNGKPKMSDVQILHQLLSQIGIKVAFRWSRSVEGHEGEKLRVYRLDEGHWQTMMGILARRQARRTSLEQKAAEQVAGSSPQLDSQIGQGDPDAAGVASAAEAQRSRVSEVLPTPASLLALDDFQSKTVVLESFAQPPNQEAATDDPINTDC